MVIRNIIIILIAYLCAQPVFAKVSADVDRLKIEEGETFVLTIFSDDDSPELEVLDQDFHRLGTSRSSQMSFVNGRMTSEKKWVVTLSPKKLGISTIPEIKVGNEKTKPIRVEVVKANVVNASGGADIFLEVKLDTNTAYVQSQVIYIARLYRAVEIREGSLTEPQINSAVVERMGEDVTFQTTRNNRRYQVTERRFALFPQQSGGLAIPPTVFAGQVLTPQPGGRSNDPFDRFFQNQQRAKRVQIKSDALTLDVLPEPANFNGKAWLPAKRLLLTESWSVDPPVFKVGEPITRTLRLEAIGQTGAQLPEFKESPAHGIKQYVDQPKVETGLVDGSLFGVREEKFAIIPTNSGKLVLPEVQLYWWDTELDKETLVTIPPRVIDVAQADIAVNQTSNTIPDSDDVEESTKEDKPAEEVIHIHQFEGGGFWPWIALGFGLAWIITMILWFQHHKKGQSIKQSSTEITDKIDEMSLSSAKKQLKQACEKNDAMAAKNAVLSWSRAAWQGESMVNLSLVGKRLHDSTVESALANLDKCLYSDNVSCETWDGKRFWDEVGQRLKKPRNLAVGRLKSLPELYPH